MLPLALRSTRSPNTDTIHVRSSINSLAFEPYDGSIGILAVIKPNTRSRHSLLASRLHSQYIMLRASERTADELNSSKNTLMKRDSVSRSSTSRWSGFLVPFEYSRLDDVELAIDSADEATDADDHDAAGAVSLKAGAVCGSRFTLSSLPLSFNGTSAVVTSLSAYGTDSSGKKKHLVKSSVTTDVSLSRATNACQLPGRVCAIAHMLESVVMSLTLSSYDGVSRKPPVWLATSSSDWSRLVSVRWSRTW